MIEEQGEVVRLEGLYAWVTTARRSSCNSCSVQSGCGSGVLAGMFGTRMHMVKAVNRINAGIGDRVVLGIDEGMMVRGSLIVYLLPLLALFGGALLGEFLAPQLNLDASELPTIVGALLGMGVGFAWLMVRNRLWAINGTFQAEILRRAPSVAPIVPVQFLHH